MGKQLETSLFDLGDFRPYIEVWARTKGRGEFRRISLALNMHTTLVSQVLHGKKCFTEEQASKLCAYMGLNHLETDYFLKLVQIERSGTEHLRNTYKRHLKEIKVKAQEIINRVQEAKELSEQDKAVYYSSWQYSIIRLLTSINRYQTIEAISEHLQINISRVQEILNFLTSRGLCHFHKGRYIRTDQNTHVEARSPLSTRHHQNWRSKSLELLEKMSVEDLAFTAPVSISKKDLSKVKEILLEAIADISKVVKDSPEEEISYLAIDWIKL